MLCLSYYCLCLLFNKIGEKGTISDAYKRDGVGGRGRGRGQGGEIAQTMYAHVNKYSLSIADNGYYIQWNIIQP
jgi:hypothetical protein